MRFQPRELPVKDPAAYVQQSLRSAPMRYDARVTVHAPAAEMRKKRWLAGAIEPIDDTSCLYCTSDDNLDWLAMRVAMLDHEYEVHGPPELVERLRAMSAKIDRACR